MRSLEFLWLVVQELNGAPGWGSFFHFSCAICALGAVRRSIIAARCVRVGVRDSVRDFTLHSSLFTLHSSHFGTPVLRYSGTPVLRYSGTSALVRSTRSARKHVEEINHVLVFGEDAVVVEVDVVAGCAFRAGEDVEEIDHVLVFGEDIVVVEIDVVA